MAKNVPFHVKSPVKKFHDRVRARGIAPCPSLKYVTDRISNFKGLVTQGIELYSLHIKFYLNSVCCVGYAVVKLSWEWDRQVDSVKESV